MSPTAESRAATAGSGPGTGGSRPITSGPRATTGVLRSVATPEVPVTPAATAAVATGSIPVSPASGPGHSGLVEVFVAPFYLSLMRLNALRAEPALIARAARAASVLSVADITALLRSGAWREEVMGAWYALSRPGDDEVRAAVLDTLGHRSAGDLTSPPLATAAVVLAGEDALGALEAFIARHTRPDQGEHGRGFCAAAAEFARGRGSRAMPRPTDADREDAGRMLHVAARFVAPAANWTLPGSLN